MALVPDMRNSTAGAQGREPVRGHVEPGSPPELARLEKLPGCGPRSHGEREPACPGPDAR